MYGDVEWRLTHVGVDPGTGTVKHEELDGIARALNQRPSSTIDAPCELAYLMRDRVTRHQQHGVFKQ